MSDDLVERLYDRRVCSPAQNSCHNDHVLNQAADRIEQLERMLGLADDQRREWERHCKKAEAKLAKAVDVDLIEQAVSDVLSEGGSYRDAAEYVARTTLAELKGQNDE